MKPQRIAPVPGTQEIFDLLSFVLDAKAVKSRLEELDAYRAKINALIEVHGKADEIDSLRSAAAEERAKAATMLSEAQEKATRIIEGARREASEAAVLADTKARSQREALEARAAELRALGESLAQLDASVKGREAEVQRKEDAARRALGEGRALKEEFEAKLAKLRAAGVA